MSSYSFKDVVCAITGVGLNANLGSGAAAGEEGITIEQSDDKNIMNIGANGNGIHSLRADDSGTITVRLLKTSRENAILQNAYNSQKASSIAWGKNTITVRDIARGDMITCTGVAFKATPSIDYGTEAQDVEWTFDAIRIAKVLGVGTPEI